MSVKLVAHRGESEAAPENTLEAFTLAWARGARCIDSDDRHVCAGTLFLPFFLSDGCSLFPASGTAVPDTGKRA